MKPVRDNGPNGWLCQACSRAIHQTMVERYYAHLDASSSSMMQIIMDPAEVEVADLGHQSDGR
jgi:hypothetical protein